MNFFITGEKGIGKSTLILDVCRKMGLDITSLAGYQTLPYYDAKGRRKGFVLHGLVAVENNDLPISRQYSAYACEPVLQTFETLGVEVLQSSRQGDTNVILLDEIGVLEGEAAYFKEEIQRVLHSKKKVVGVLKLTESLFIKEIANRKDTQVYTLTRENYTEVSKALTVFLEKGEC